MPISNKRSVLVLTGLAVSNLLLAAAAEAQGVSFIASRDLSVGIHPLSVAVGDFNGDGTPDLVVANAGSSNVSVLLGNGDGSFQAAQSPWPWATSMAMAGPTWPWPTGVPTMSRS
jgi:hypothetical protein